MGELKPSGKGRFTVLAPRYHEENKPGLFGGFDLVGEGYAGGGLEGAVGEDLNEGGLGGEGGGGYEEED